MAAVKFVIIGGGPAGVEAAATASRFGAHVTLIEREVIGGAANLWDCIPSKAMIATGGVRSLARRSKSLGMELHYESPNLELLRARVASISERLATSTERQLTGQGVTIVRGVGSLRDSHHVEVVADGGDFPEFVLEADAILLATGSAPRVPDWAEVDGDRVM